MVKVELFLVLLSTRASRSVDCKHSNLSDQKGRRLPSKQNPHNPSLFLFAYTCTEEITNKPKLSFNERFEEMACEDFLTCKINYSNLKSSSLICQIYKQQIQSIYANKTDTIINYSINLLQK